MPATKAPDDDGQPKRRKAAPVEEVIKDEVDAVLSTNGVSDKEVDLFIKANLRPKKGHKFVRFTIANVFDNTYRLNVYTAEKGGRPAITHSFFVEQVVDSLIDKTHRQEGSNA